MAELRAAHLNTVLGNLWHLLNPALLVGVYYLVFGVIIGTDRGIDNFIAFLAIGIILFRFTQSSVQMGAKSIAGNDGLIRSIYFPRALLPMAAAIQQLLLLIPALFVVLVVALLSGQRPLASWLLLPFIVLVQTCFNLGAAFVAARVADSFRDFQNILPFVFRLLFYVSGVLYAVDIYVTSRATRLFFELNPCYAFITIARQALLAQSVPTPVYFSALGWTLVLLVAGFFFFRAAEPNYGRG